MNQSEIKEFNKANQTVHSVENHWSFATMSAHGYKPAQSEGKGFVRQFDYVKGDHTVSCSTGANADWWKDNLGNFGYWGTLKHHIETYSSQAV